VKEKFIAFETDFVTELTKVNDGNYTSVIKELESLIMTHKSILSKSQVLTVLYKINYEFEMNKLQEKLFFEMEQKIVGGYSFT